MPTYQVYIDLHKLGMMTCAFYFFIFNLRTDFNSLEIVQENFFSLLVIKTDI